MTPPVLPLRERIERELETRLLTIASSDTYWTSPVLVTRALLTIDQYAKQLKDGPVLGVMRFKGSRFAAGSHTSWEHRHVVAVWGFVLGQEPGGNIAGDLLNRLWEDVNTCLLEDTTLGGLVADLSSHEEMETDEGGREPYGFFRQQWLAVK